ncbi:uncharacterized protein LOC130606948 [Pezoporus wallicus]|uniref:uncharacterized protein LOC130606948 n=1 Tax=Pezoporus wallicus TaxID=35540 RepID=UPI00254E1578|nr:uncharacterized protein LOC130606948 [Pezoporus wallicus]
MAAGTGTRWRSSVGCGAGRMLPGPVVLLDTEKCLIQRLLDIPVAKKYPYTATTRLDHSPTRSTLCNNQSRVLTPPGPLSSLGPRPGRASRQDVLAHGLQEGLPQAGGTTANLNPGSCHPLQPDPWEPFPGLDFHVAEENRGWAPNNCLPPPSWHNEECDQGPVECFGEGQYSVWGGGPGGWQLRGCLQCATVLTGGDLPLQPWLSEPGPFPGPDDLYGNEENRRWGPHDVSPPRHWDNEECDQRPEACFGEGWYPVRRNGPEGWQLCGCSLHATVLTGDHLPLQLWSCDPRPFPGPADYCGNEEYRGWAPNDWSAPCFWGARGDGGPEECFGEGWHPEMMPPGPSRSTWREFPNERQHSPWPPAHQTEEQGGFQDDCKPWGFHGPSRRHCQRLRRAHRKPTTVLRPLCVQPRGYWPPSRSTRGSGTSQPVVKEEPLTPIKAPVQSGEQQAKVVGFHCLHAKR